MSNRSDRFIEYLMAIVLLYSRLFGICNYDYNFETGRLTHPRWLVIYTIIVDVMIIVFFPVSIWIQTETRNEQFTKKPITAEIYKLLSTANALAICSSLIGQWTNPAKLRILFKQLNTVRKREASNLERSTKAVLQMTILFLGKILLSILFVVSGFVTKYLQSKHGSVADTFNAVYFTIVENLILIVGNQFYVGILYTGYLFELLNNRIKEAVDDILTLGAKLTKRKNMGILMQKCCSLSDELDVIGKIHTDIRDMTITIKDLYQIQILTILATVFITQVSLCFYGIIYSYKNKIGMRTEIYYMGAMDFYLSVGNLVLLIYACGAVVYQCDIGAELLKPLNSVPLLDDRLEKAVEVLTFQLKREKMRLTLCGLMDIGWHTAFTLLNATIYYIVLLLQLDYMNL